MVAHGVRHGHADCRGDRPQSRIGLVTMFAHWCRPLLSRLQNIMEPPPRGPRQYFISTRASRGPGVRFRKTTEDGQRSRPAVLQDPWREPLSAPLPSASRPSAQASVVCCIEDAAASSRSALEFAARLAGRSNALLIVVTVGSSSSFFPLDPNLVVGWADGNADVKAMIDDVSAYFGVAIRDEEVSSWSQPDIARIAREQRSRAVILPMLDNRAGPLMRWRQRSLVSGLIARTRAVIIDEYDRPGADRPLTSIVRAPRRAGSGTVKPCKGGATVRSVA